MYRIIKKIPAIFIVIVFIFSACVSAAKEKPQAEKEAETPTIPEFATSRPRAEKRDELTVAFSKNDVELDFRKSYLAGEAQLYTAIYEGL